MSLGSAMKCGLMQSLLHLRSLTCFLNNNVKVKETKKD